MIENMEMRKVLANWLDEKMAEDSSIAILDADLALANGTTALYEKYPNQAFNVGIAEANMASVAAGLSAYGFKPFIFSFCPFVTRRICDQVTISIAYAGRNVKIIGTDPGLSAAFNGGTHMSMEDIGVLRSIPDMVIFEPVDQVQLIKALPQIMEYEGAMYIRLFRKVPPAVIFDEEAYDFNLFKADVLRDGTDITLFATGIEVKEALEAAEILERDGISAEVVNVHTIKPLDEETILESVQKTGCAVTCENHNIHGGLGSAISELLIKNNPVPMDFVGMDDAFSEVGVMAYVVKKYGLDSESIAEKAKAIVRAKDKEAKQIEVGV